MEASGEQTRELMDDIRAVDWLPLSEALVRLSRGSERAFLETVGPLAINGLSRRLKAKSPVVKEPVVKEPAARKRRPPTIIAPEPGVIAPSLVEPAPQPLQPELVLPTAVTDEIFCAASEVLAAEPPTEAEIAARTIEPDFCATSEPVNGAADAAVPANSQRRSFADRLRDWLGGAA
jgi:8-oxo-dGTP diphosphatase